MRTALTCRMGTPAAHPARRRHCADMRTPTPLPPAVVGPVFPVRDALAAGAGRSRLRAGDLVAVAHGLRAPRGTIVTERDLGAAVIRDRPEAVLSHLTAARIWGLPLPLGTTTGVTPGLLAPGQGLRERPAPIDVTIPPGHPRPRAGWVRVHVSEVPGPHIARAHGVRLTSRVRTFLDLGTILDEESLVVIADHLVRIPRAGIEGRARPFATPSELADGARAMGARRGVARVRAALDRSRIGADSAQETRMRLALLRAGLPEPELNTAIIGPDGRRLHEPDAQWPQHRVAVEYEGPHHRTASQLERDIARAETMRSIGWVEVRLTASDARRAWARGIERVRGALRERGWTG